MREIVAAPGFLRPGLRASSLEGLAIRKKTPFWPRWDVTRLHAGMVQRPVLAERASTGSMSTVSPICAVSHSGVEGRAQKTGMAVPEGMAGVFGGILAVNGLETRGGLPLGILYFGAGV